MIDFSGAIKFSVFLLLFQGCIFSVSAQGIRGKVISEEGKPLAYATVFARNLNDGIPTNQDGMFEWKLSPGNYDIIVQYLGYQSKLQTVEVKEGWITMDFILET
ncbi:MAG: carboxypeptidase-like regulatory domain-containing protein, partial [Cyclobacteriaceae bacterium]